MSAEPQLHHEFATALPELCVGWLPVSAPAPELRLLNHGVAAGLDIDPEALRSDEWVRVLAGGAAPEGAQPVSQAYAGHQFGGYSPRLGDGRAVLLGEIAGGDGRLVDLHLKGSGRTVFSRGGDGKASLGPMLREYVVSEAMAALRIPTTRALAVTETGEDVWRDGPERGAVLARVAASHIRVGTFQFAAATGDVALLARLIEFAIRRHFPRLSGRPDAALELLGAVVHSQAELVASWMHVGFVHGVMNTDNVAISGETIDYGPCAFMDRHDAATVFSSIDHQGRYAYGNQPSVMQWNLARFAETLLAAIDDDRERAIAAATDTLHGYAPAYRSAWLRGARAKLGIGGGDDEADHRLVDDLLELMTVARADHTLTFRDLARWLRGDRDPLTARLASGPGLAEWLVRWTGRVGAAPRDAVADAMDAVNPIYIPRNAVVEDALAAAVEERDLGEVERLVAVLADPFTERSVGERYALASPPDYDGAYTTFCGT